jgi:hypothetical protein
LRFLTSSSPNSCPSSPADLIEEVSDAITHRFRVRPVTIVGAVAVAAYVVGADEHAFDFTFAASSAGRGTRAMFILAGLVSVAFGVLLFARPGVGTDACEMPRPGAASRWPAPTSRSAGAQYRYDRRGYSLTSDGGRVEVA